MTRLRGCHDREQVTGEEAGMESKASREKPPSLCPSLLVPVRAREAERRPTCGCEGSERKKSRDGETLKCLGQTGAAACERLESRGRRRASRADGDGDCWTLEWALRLSVPGMG